MHLSRGLQVDLLVVFFALFICSKLPSGDFLVIFVGSLENPGYSDGRVSFV